MAEKWYDKTLIQLENKLNTNVSSGLTKKAAFGRLKHIGNNIIYPIPKGSFKLYLSHILTDFTSILLIITAALAAVFEQNVSAVVILCILFLNYAAAVFSYVKAQRVMEGMGQYALPTAKVMREGMLYMVKQELLVPGDIIFVSAGDIVPADARLIEADRLTALEVNLTGETKSVLKDPLFIEYGEIPPSQQKNMLFTSSIITNGTGKAVVCETGDDTLVCQLGKNTPIVSHDKLEILAVLKKYCTVWSLCMIGMIFLLTLLDLIVGLESSGLFHIFLTALTLAVAAMSEFYIAFGYIIVACGIFNANNRAKEINTGALIKNTAKLETLKKLTCLLVPKECAFSVRDSRIEMVYANGIASRYDERGYTSNAAQTLRYAVISTGIYGSRKLVSNNARFENIYTPEEDAIIAAAEACSIYNIGLEQRYPIVEHAAVSSGNRFETTLVNCEGKYVAAVRGEASKILENCRYYCENGRIYPMTGEKLNELKITASHIAKEAYRVIAVASKNTVYTNLTRIIACQSDMTFEGFLAIREPLLPGAAKNISKCRAAGIKIIMMCDDISENNRYIAEALGVIQNESEIVDSNQIYHMREGLFRANIPLYSLYQGLNINQKRTLLHYLREDGEIVGVLGRELDEIILLKEADVGITQSVTLSGKAGKNGVDLISRRIPVFAKNAKATSTIGCEALKFVADVIVSEADRKGSGGLNAIIGAITCSKVIYQNLLRMVRYLITSQTARLCLVLYSVLTKNVIFTPVQIIFCGLLVDFAAVVIIAFERPSYHILSQKENTEQRLKKPLRHNIESVLFGIFWAVATVTAPLLCRQIGIEMEPAHFLTMAFVSFIFTQIAILNETMKEKSVFYPSVRFNRIYGAVTLSIALFLALAFLIQPFGALFDITGMPFRIWLVTLAIPAVMTLLYEIYKLITSHAAKPRKTPLHIEFGDDENDDEHDEHDEENDI